MELSFPDRLGIANYDLFCLLVEWSWLLLMAPYEQDGKERFVTISELLIQRRDEVLAGLMERDDRMRLICAKWICSSWKQQREHVLLTLLQDSDPYIRCRVIDDCVVFPSESVFNKLIELIRQDSDSLVVSYATRHLSFFTTDANRREIIRILLDVLDRPFTIDWRAEYGEEQHPHDAAIYALEEALSTCFLGQPLDGVVAMASPQRFDLVVENARRFMQSN